MPIVEWPLPTAPTTAPPCKPWHRSGTSPSADPDPSRPSQIFRKITVRPEVMALSLQGYVIRQRLINHLTERLITEGQAAGGRTAPSNAPARVERVTGFGVGEGHGY